MVEELRVTYYFIWACWKTYTFIHFLKVLARMEKSNQPCLGFELGSPILFPILLTFTLSGLACVCVQRFLCLYETDSLFVFPCFNSTATKWSSTWFSLPFQKQECSCFSSHRESWQVTYYNILEKNHRFRYGLAHRLIQRPLISWLALAIFILSQTEMCFFLHIRRRDGPRFGKYNTILIYFVCKIHINASALKHIGQ